jgi:hypothetical protein
MLKPYAIHQIEMLSLEAVGLSIQIGAESSEIVQKIQIERGVR